MVIIRVAVNNGKLAQCSIFRWNRWKELPDELCVWSEGYH